MPKDKPARQQRKRRVRISKAAPFPVPISSVSGECASDTNWIYYAGVLEDNCVVVKHTGDMDFLYRMGFFGKGSMSRGQPEWSEHWRVVTLPWQPSSRGRQQTMIRAKVTSRRRYMTHLKWHLLSKGDRPALDKVQEDEQRIVEDTWPSQGGPSDLDNCDKASAAQETAVTADVERGSEPVPAGGEQGGPGERPDWEDEEGDGDFWEAEETASSPAEVASSVPAASWDMEDPGDADFWGQDDGSGLASSEPLHPCDSPRAGEPADFSSEAVDANRPVRVENCPETDTSSECAVQLTASDAGIVKESSSQFSPVSCGASQQTRDIRASGTDPSKPGAYEQTCPRRHAGTAGCDDDRPSLKTATSEQLAVSQEHSEGSRDRTTPGRQARPVGDRAAADEESTPNTVGDSCGDAAGVKGGSSGGEFASHCDVEWSQFCADSDNSTAVQGCPLFVVPDSDDEEPAGEGQVCRVRTKWEPVIKNDPFPVKENLHLSFEEAFFLSYGLGCLSVVDSKQSPMNLQRLWKEFCGRQPSFLPNYVAYHHYRSKNWVPKTGLKFGCTFLLYKDGPPFYHGSYSVVVRFVGEDGKSVQGFEEQRPFSWTSLAGLKRITEHVGKELMFCYVIKPKEMSAEDMLSPKCIGDFHIKEVTVSRWVSSQEREDSTFD